MRHKRRSSRTGLDHVKTVVRGGVEYCYFNTGQKSVDGKPIRLSLGRKDHDDFGTRYATALANRKRRGTAPAAFLVPELIRLFERQPTLTARSHGTQKTYGVYLRRLAHEMDTAPADSVEPRDIYALVDRMADTPAAAEMMLLVCRKFFGWAKKRHHISTDPTVGVELDDERAAGEYEPWPEHLVEEALADPKVSLAVALLYFTAQRIGDVCHMRWSDIRDSVVHVVQQKTGKALEIPVHYRLAEILAAAPRKGITILTDPKGRMAKHGTIRGWLQDFAAARGFKVVPHGLRKNAVNALLEAECSTGETAAISGQSLRMVEFYAKRRNNPKMSKAAILKWERAGNGETAGKTGSERRGNA